MTRDRMVESLHVGYDTEASLTRAGGWPIRRLNSRG